MTSRRWRADFIECLMPDTPVSATDGIYPSPQLSGENLWTQFETRDLEHQNEDLQNEDTPSYCGLWILDGFRCLYSVRVCL